MKKFFAVFLSSLLVFTLCACGAEKDEQTQEPETKEFSRGVIDGNVYISEFANLKFAPDESWIFATDEEIAEIMGYSSDEFIEEEFQESIKNNEYKSVYDFMAQDSVTGSNVITTFENLALTVGGTSYDEEAYAEATRDLLSQASSSISYTFSEDEEITLAGAECLFFSAEADYNGSTIEQIYFLRRIDKYMFSIIITVQGDYTADDILSFFSAAE